MSSDVDLNSKGKPGRPAGGKNLTTKPYAKFDVNGKIKFLRRLEKTGQVADAASFVGVSRDTVYKAAQKDPRFKEKMDIARERCVAKLEKELDERLYKGNEKVEYDGGGNVLRKTVTKDNALLTKALESHYPEKYGKKSEQKSDTTIVIGDSAISKLAAFLKVDLPEKEVGGVIEDEEAIEGEWEEYEEGS